MEMLDLIHEGHQGIEKCLLHSRESLFWPGISNEIHQTVDKCGICQATSTAQRKLPSVPSEIPPKTWHTLGTDLFYLKLSQVQHATSSLHFPQYNGFAEAMVKIAKKLMDHSTLQKKPWNFGLMEYRCIPLTENIPSPLELLTGQKPRTSLPSIPQGNSTTREHHEVLIKKQQMDISEELSISIY